MMELITRLAGMIEDTIIEAEDEPQFTTRERATTGAEEIYRELIMPVLTEAWDEGHNAGQHNELEYRPGRAMTNPYPKETQE